jgi:hypothetical protein
MMPRLILMGISKYSFVIKGFKDLNFCFFCFKTKEIAEGKNDNKLKYSDEKKVNFGLTG